MKVLLDTHAFLWWVDDDERLSGAARRAIGSPRNDVLVSSVTAWEIATKAAAGRLTISQSAKRFIPTQLAANGFEVLPLQLSHALAGGDLPPVHRDPFDRLLVAQALVEKVPLVTGDRVLAGYPIRIIW